MKQLIKTVAIALLVLPTTLSAQQQVGQGMRPGGGPGGPGRPAGFDPANRMERLVRFLELSDAQQVQIEEIMATHRESREALSGIMRSQNEALQGILEGQQPDPTAIGKRVLEIHDLRKQMTADQETQVNAVREQLTPEQAERFDALMAARDFGRDRDGGGPGRARPDRERGERPPRG
jgi:Spy/CpxP family protein refolding chaperone